MYCLILCSGSCEPVTRTETKEFISAIYKGGFSFFFFGSGGGGGGGVGGVVGKVT